MTSAARIASRVRTVAILAAITVLTGHARWRDGTAFAATFVVDSTSDVAAADGVVTLREAITAANFNVPINDAPAGNSGLDTITFAPGLNGGTITLGGAELAITESLTIEGPPDRITLNANGASRVFHVASAAFVQMSRLVITHGRAPMGENGGGIRMTASSLGLEDVVIDGNAASGGFAMGGGIACTGGYGSLRVSASVITNNSAESEGGGLFADAACSGVVTRSTITNNVLNGNGGGISNRGWLRIEDSTIAGNAGFNGGGVFSTYSLEVYSSTVNDNHAMAAGGGLGVQGAVTVVNSTIAGNESVGFPGGGGLFVTHGGTILHSTITRNVDASASGHGAGGIVSTAQIPLSFHNNIVALNSATGDPPDIRAIATAGLGNVIGIGTAELTGIADGLGNKVGTQGAPIDPKLGALTNNGGPTATCALLPGSPAIDAGVNLRIPAGIVTDQRGFPRLAGPLLLVDAGAVEFGNTPTTTTTTTTSTTGTTRSTTTTTVPPSCAGGCPTTDPCTPWACVGGICVASAVVGVASAACVCDRDRPSACAGLDLPASIAKRSSRACATLRRAGSESGRRQRRLLGQAGGIWDGARRLVGKRKIARATSADCASALSDAYDDAARRARDAQ